MLKQIHFLHFNRNHSDPFDEQDWRTVQLHVPEYSRQPCIFLQTRACSRYDYVHAYGICSVLKHGVRHAFSWLRSRNCDTRTCTRGWNIDGGCWLFGKWRQIPGRGSYSENSSHQTPSIGLPRSLPGVVLVFLEIFLDLVRHYEHGNERSEEMRM